MNEELDDYEQVFRAASQLTPGEKQMLIEQLTATLVAAQSGTGPRPLRSMFGIWKDLPHISDEDIQQARKEMWGNFPREDIV